MANTFTVRKRQNAERRCWFIIICRVIAAICLWPDRAGCGKTEIWRTLQKKFSFIKIINGSRLSCDGWKGSYHVKDIFLEEKPQMREHMIVVVDEADKLFEPMVGSGGTDFSRSIQNEFLKLIDGDQVTFVNEDNRKRSTDGKDRLP